MTISKTQRGLLVTAVLFSLPVIVASWWMLSSGTPATPSADGAGRGEKMPSSLNAVEGATATRAGVRVGVADEAKDVDDGRTAEDFLVYASTLKAQGYTEETVRELVASQITAAFERRRTAIRTQSARGKAGAEEIQLQLDALNGEQGALIGRLLVAGEKPVVVVATAESAVANAEPVGAAGQTLMPAVMASEMPATVKTEEQAAAWEKLRNDFVNAIGGENQDPADPKYRQRWVRAESEANQRFRLLFGDNAFVQHQMKAQQEAAARH